LQDPDVDFAVIGEGENAFCGLMQKLRDKADPADSPGTACLRNGNILQGPSPELADMDKFPIPAYELLDIEQYITTQTLGQRDLGIVTSRGCPSACRYCYNVPFSGRKWRAQKAETVIEHIRYIVERFKLSAVLFKDDNFFVNQDRVTKILENIHDLKILLRGECRADYLADRFEPDYLKWIRSRGFAEMTVGAESGSDNVLEYLGKGINIDQIRRANRRLRDAGISVKYTFMTGFPGETEGDMKQTLTLMLDLLAENPLARTTPLHLYTPYPGTTLYDESRTLGFTPPEKMAQWAYFDFHDIHVPWISRSKRRKLVNASIATYFLDSTTVAEYFHNKAMTILVRIYGAVVRMRARFNFFSLMPEIKIFQWIREMKKMV